jgi:hypothetical protein
MSTIISSAALSAEMAIGILINSIVIMLLAALLGLPIFSGHEL